ncbi:flagellar protein FlhE [Biostraticola tofi]|uniref:Flagellar protein FlhE n=1 Tax=Biostraticola tofi TaxID=466109 RepID=A0A4R3YRE7_9GAMM|nr:flagellar protein FlhE [Biostraticola tofi]TCV95535.1 flagellar protein FlhE [Biostraticola tofi]
MILAFTCCQLLPAVGLAAAGGSWSATGHGGELGVGNQAMTTQPLSAPAGHVGGARVVSYSWDVQLFTTPEASVRVDLCSAQRCTRLSGLSGRASHLAGDGAEGPFRFIYRVETHGRLMPPLQILSNQLTVNYR